MKSWLRGKGTGLIAFLVICTLVIGGLGWVTAAVLRLEEQQHANDFEKELNGQLRLALWRLDSRVAPTLAREDSRPYNHYSAFFAPAVTFRCTGEALEPGQVVEPSPLLSAELPEWMLLHFQADADCGWCSPQVPAVSQVRILENKKLSASLDNVTRGREDLLDHLYGYLEPGALLSCVEQRGSQPTTTDSTLVQAHPQYDNKQLLKEQQSQTAENNIAPKSQQETYGGKYNNYGNNDKEFLSRGQVQGKVMKEANAQKPQTIDMSWALTNTLRNGEGLIVRNPAKATRSQKIAVSMGSMVPLWLKPAGKEERLIVARLVKMGDKQLCQGIVLDWPRLQAVLAEEVGETFPEAVFEPVHDAEPLYPERTMKWLPVQLNPGPVEPPPMPAWTPLRIGLALAWAAALIALSAVGLGGWSLIDLSERRIRFVSAVTHELRTPLTTLRLYLDMMTGGMVQEEEQKTEYLQTLHSETERLNRLVANVLDFSRLERQRPRLERSRVPVGELLEQVRADWEERCKSVGKELVVDCALGVEAPVKTDVKLVQQVLGNLIDNACKYSHDAADCRIWLRARHEGKRLLLEVEDRGPGVPLRERRSIFRPFRRGHSADVTAGGVGLGLALSRQWAKLLGGRLALGAGKEGSGACFGLDLPA